MMLACCVNGFRGALCALLAAYRKNNDNCRHNDDKHDQNRRQDSCGLFVFLHEIKSPLLLNIFRQLFQQIFLIAGFLFSSDVFCRFS